MEQRNAVKTAARVAKREAKLGPDAVCVGCGQANPEALSLVDRTIVEEHHVVGREHEGKLTVPLCANCHRVLTEKVRNSGASMKATPNFLEKLVSMLRAIEAFFTMLGETCGRWADKLARLITGLDEACPNWREVAEAV